MYYFNIAFDVENKKEYFYYYTMEDYDDGFYHAHRNVLEQKLGTFLLEFLNTNFRKRKNFDQFVTKYCFMSYYSKLISKSIYTLKVNKEDLKPNLNKIYEKYSEDFIMFSEIFRDIANTKTFYKNFSNYLKTENPKQAEIEAIKAYNFSTKDYWKQLLEFSDLFESIYLDFQMIDFYNNETFSEDIPYSFKSPDLLNIIYLSFKHIECYKHPILKCQNCKKLFIPDSAHDIKYCNEIYKNNKTCKQLAPELKYKKTLESDPILKKYRSRYQSLQRQATDKPEKYRELYENYKVEGNKMQKQYKEGFITAQEFEEWIDGTKLKKENSNENNSNKRK